MAVLFITDGEYDVLLNSYFKLSRLLPVEKIIPKLVTKRVIDLDDEEEIMSLTTARKRAVYILHKIAAPLGAGYTEKFYQLLTIMEEYGGDVAKLADEIRTSLKEFAGRLIVLRHYLVKSWFSSLPACIFTSTPILPLHGI